MWSPAPILVAGPCALDGDAVNLPVAETLARLGAQLGVRVVFKGSFDKANRARGSAPRGPGLGPGLEQLARVRAETGLPLLTDVHEAWQVPDAGAVVDVLQVPAMLSRQTDLLLAVGSSGRAVNIKKGQWMAPEDLAGAVGKVRSGGALAIAVTERGSAFGYGDLIVDMRVFTRARHAADAPVLYDATHSVQRPGKGPGGASGGDRELVPSLLKAAAAAGADGFYIETHPDPASAPSDAAVMWPLNALEELVEGALEVWHAANARRIRA